MRKWCGLFLAATALLVAAPSSAVMLPYSSTFTLELGTFPPVPGTASGMLDVTTSGGLVTNFNIPAAQMFLSLNTPVNPPIPLVKGVATLTGVTLMASNTAGTFTVTGANGTGKMGSKGASVLKVLFLGSPSDAKIPLTGGLGVPGGKVTAKILGLAQLTVTGKAWTLGKVSATSTPFGGGKSTVVTRMGSQTIIGTAQSAGRVQHFNFVTPGQITIVATSTTKTASFGSLAIDFTVPEAGGILLLAAGGLVLAAASRWRRTA